MLNMHPFSKQITPAFFSVLSERVLHDTHVPLIFHLCPHFLIMNTLCAHIYTPLEFMQSHTTPQSLAWITQHSFHLSQLGHSVILHNCQMSPEDTLRTNTIGPFMFWTGTVTPQKITHAVRINKRSPHPPIRNPGTRKDTCTHRPGANISPVNTQCTSKGLRVVKRTNTSLHTLDKADLLRGHTEGCDCHTGKVLHAVHVAHLA